MHASLLVATSTGCDQTAVQALVGQGRVREQERQIEEAEHLYRQALARIELLQAPELHVQVLLSLGGWNSNWGATIVRPSAGIGRSNSCQKGLSLVALMP
jgi:hypothetical protein